MSVYFRLLARESKLRESWIELRGIDSDKRLLECLRLLYAIKRKNFLCTRSIDSFNPTCEGFQIIEQYSNVGLTKEMNNVFKHCSFLNSLVFLIKNPRVLREFTQIWSTCGWNDKLVLKITPRSLMLLISSICLSKRWYTLIITIYNQYNIPKRFD